MNKLIFIANAIIKECRDNEIKAYIWHTATTGSVYIRFEDSRMNSIRIADHEGRGHLKYKFNIRSDLKLSKGKWKKDDTWRYYLPIHLWKEIIPILIEKHLQLQKSNTKQYSYFIPKFKKQQV